MKEMKKLRSRSGMTLAETLLTTLILLLVSLLMATGVPMARSVYERVTIGANAKVLLTTAVSALRNELGTAKNVSVDTDSGEIVYYSTDTRAWSRIYLYVPGPDKDKEPGQTERGGKVQPLTAMLQEYIKNDEAALSTGEARGLGKPRPLVTGISATNMLYFTYDSVSFSGDLISFQNLRVRRGAEPVDRAFLEQLDIRVEFGPVTTKTP